MDSTNFDQSSDRQANLSKYKFLSSLRLSEDITRRLSLHLDNIVMGNVTVYLAAIAKEHGPEYILQEVDKLFENGKDKLSTKLVEFELSNRDKYGPRSIAKPWSERVPDLDTYFSSKVTNPSSAKVKFKSSGSLRSISLSNASSLLKSNTNSGLPYYTKKKNVITRVIDKYDDVLSKNFPCILFTRTQEGNKTRTVWGYPIADTLREMTVYSPLLSYQKKLPWRTSLLGPDAVDGKLSKIFRDISELDGFLLLSIDFSAYDSSVSKELQSLSFNYIKSLFQLSDHGLIDTIKDRFNTIGIVTPSGIMTGNHGVPSGSTFTNEVDSIVQYICAISSGAEIIDFEIQGDDGLYLIAAKDVDVFKSHLKSNGLIVNDDKSYLSSNYCIFLQRLYDNTYFKDGKVCGIYSLYRAICRIVFQERYSNFEDFDLNGLDYYSIRTITILENVKYHPLFKEFVALVYKLDKYKLNYSSKSVANYSRMINEGSGTGSFLYNQFSDKVDGINNFETVKIIKQIENKPEL